MTTRGKSSETLCGCFTIPNQGPKTCLQAKCCILCLIIYLANKSTETTKKNQMLLMAIVRGHCLHSNNAAERPVVWKSTHTKLLKLQSNGWNGKKDFQNLQNSILSTQHKCAHRRKAVWIPITCNSFSLTLAIHIQVLSTHVRVTFFFALGKQWQCRSTEFCLIQFNVLSKLENDLHFNLRRELQSQINFPIQSKDKKIPQGNIFLQNLAWSYYNGIPFKYRLNNATQLKLQTKNHITKLVIKWMNLEKRHWKIKRH